MAFKNLTRFRQWTGERLGMSSKTETSEEFRKLEQEIDAKRDFVDNITPVSEAYMNTLTKRTKSDKNLIMESLGVTMSTLGSQLNDSEYGKSLVKTGQLQYSVKLKGGFMNSLERAKEELKDIRLVVQKSKKERPELEEDMRAAQTRYEEVMADTHNKMVSISELEEVQHRDLIGFVEAQIEYFRKGLEVMAAVQQSLGDPTLVESRRRISHTEDRTAEISDTQSIMSARTGHSIHSPAMPVNTTLANPMRQSIPQQVNAITSATTPKAPVSSNAAHSSSKYVEALYNYDATDEDELSIVKGDIIAVIEELDEGWWVGEQTNGTGKRGMFPANYSAAAMARPPYARQSSVTSSGGSGGSSAAPPPRPTGAKPPSARPPITATVTPPSIATMANVATASHAYLPPSVMGAQSGPPSSAVGPCSQCGCTEFSPNVFKKGSCNNCFHKH
ncbi:hypothetical protein BDF22DRAFT_670612 [Syncephalis plumigaleata]|nr:hypothetical protein BDF22DRAFT_670612 [Syncephalis plumigaleata]